MFSLCAINREAHMKFEHIKDFVKEKYKGGSELEFEELANGEFKIYATKKL